ncbi:hypothetical protein [Streptomyces sp. NPDC058045]|uniref:hypothetical protein n=1 Tax=Streptomyces sp. NPDC058045 TaxID=3346311 RepID=UPI0036F0E5D2
MNIRFASTAVAAAAGAVLLTVAPAATAAAPTGSAATAPAARAAAPLQAEFPVTVKGAEMTYQGRTYTFDLTGKASITVDAPTPGKLTTQATGTLSVTAENTELGKIVMQSTAIGTASFNSALKPFPAKLDLSANGALSIENAGTTAEGTQASEPMVLQTQTPAHLMGNLNQFPPSGDVLALQNPVDLAAGDSSDTVASVTKFPLTVGTM